MIRQEITAQIRDDFGFIPDWLADMPGLVLERLWDNLKWVISDTGLSARDKALISFGAATAFHCPY